MKARSLALSIVAALLFCQCTNSQPEFHAKITDANGKFIGRIDGTYSDNKSKLETYCGLGGQLLSQLLTTRITAP